MRTALAALADLLASDVTLDELEVAADELESLIGKDEAALVKPYLERFIAAKKARIGVELGLLRDAGGSPN